LCVVLLFALTLLATALAADHRFQLRVESNQEMAEFARDQSMSALQEGEHWLRHVPDHSQPQPCASECTAEQVLWRQLAVPYDLALKDLTWWQRHAQKAAPTLHLLPSGMTLEGRGYWLISEIDVRPEHPETQEYPATPEPTTAYYRIAALGQTGHESAPFIGEAIFIKTWGGSTAAPASPEEPDAVETCQPATHPPCGRVAWRRLR
jgi:Tfp pilus assembly protein PilX